MRRSRRRSAPASRHDAPAPPGRWPEGPRRLALGLLLFCGFVLILGNWEAGLTTNGDDAQYVVLAHSILEGKGMRHVNDPLERPHLKYPPLYPTLLAPFAALNDRFAAAGEAWALKIPSVVASLVTLWLAFLLVERRMGSGPALLVAGLTAANLFYMEFSQMVMAEIPYAALTMAALVALDRWAAVAGRPPTGPEEAAASGGVLRSREAWIALLLVAAAYYTRTVGLALAGGTILFFLIRRQRSPALFTAGVFVLAALPWFIRNRMLGTPGTYLQQLFLKNPYQPELGTAGVADFAQRILENLRIYGLGAVPQLLFPYLGGIWGQNPWSWTIVIAVATTGIAAGFVPRLRRGFTPTEMYVGVTFAICIAWPTVWSSERFILPILPLLLFYFVDGGRRILAWAGGRWAWFTPRALAWPLAGILLAVDGMGARAAIERPREPTPDWVSYYQAADWVRENTPPASVIVCRKPYLFYFRAHRKTIGYVFSTDPREVLASVAENGATHVVVDCFRWTTTTYRYLIPALQSLPGAFEVVYETQPVFADRPDRSYVLAVTDPSALTGEAP